MGGSGTLHPWMGRSERNLRGVDAPCYEMLDSKSAIAFAGSLEDVLDVAFLTVREPLPEERRLHRRSCPSVNTSGFSWFTVNTLVLPPSS